MSTSFTHRRFASVLAATLAGVLLALVISPTAGATADDEATLYALINASRASEGLIPLQYDPAASGVARAWAEHMAATDELYHNPNLAAEVNRDVTTDWQRLGENVGYTHSDAAQAHQNYMDSPGHRANVMGDYTRVGVGSAYSDDGRLWTTVVFIKMAPVEVPEVEIVPAQPPRPAPAPRAPAPTARVTSVASPRSGAELITVAAAPAVVAEVEAAPVVRPQRIDFDEMTAVASEDLAAAAPSALAMGVALGNLAVWIAAMWHRRSV